MFLPKTEIALGERIEKRSFGIWNFAIGNKKGNKDKFVLLGTKQNKITQLIDQLYITEIDFCIFKIPIWWNGFTGRHYVMGVEDPKMKNQQ